MGRRKRKSLLSKEKYNARISLKIICSALGSVRIVHYSCNRNVTLMMTKILVPSSPNNNQNK
jgi:hypothetical protein